MSEIRLGVIMNGVTGRMGTNQHLIRSILAIRRQGGVVLSNNDRVIPHEHALQLADSVAGETTLNLVEDGGHVANNRIYKYRNQSADWMADKLAIN
jgi:predicted alpha/beta hydrolase family esterase